MSVLIQAAVTNYCRLGGVNQHFPWFRAWEVWDPGSVLVVSSLAERKQVLCVCSSRALSPCRGLHPTPVPLCWGIGFQHTHFGGHRHLVQEGVDPAGNTPPRSVVTLENASFFSDDMILHTEILCE